MAIYGSNFAVSRAATLGGLTPSDLVALRFGTAGILMLPFFLARGGLRCAGLGWRRGFGLALAGGAPMSLCMNTGLSMAPAAHGAAIGPGTVTVIGLIYGIVAARAAPSLAAILGLAVILAGLVTIAVAGSGAASGNVPLGDLLFFMTGCLWGFYPIMLHRWRVDPMTSAAVVSVLSLLYLPVYAASGTSHLPDAPLGVLVFQAFFQGVLNVIVALWLWGHAVRSLGAERTQLYPPLIPVLGTLFAVPILGEVPSLLQVLGLTLIVVGIIGSVLANRRRPADGRP